MKMKVIQPIEIIVLAISLVLSAYLVWSGKTYSEAALTFIIGLLLTLLLVSYRLVSYITAFLTEVAPSFAVVRDFLRKFGS
jgi:CHASE2 domain-containing sensor protein